MIQDVPQILNLGPKWHPLGASLGSLPRYQHMQRMRASLTTCASPRLHIVKWTTNSYVYFFLYISFSKQSRSQNPQLKSITQIHRVTMGKTRVWKLVNFSQTVGASKVTTGQMTGLFKHAPGGKNLLIDLPLEILEMICTSNSIPVCIHDGNFFDVIFGGALRRSCYLTPR